jgi:hypothetical protein
LLDTFRPPDFAGCLLAKGRAGLQAGVYVGGPDVIADLSVLFAYRGRPENGLARTFGAQYALKAPASILIPLKVMFGPQLD